jgi:hypothetical protein
MLLDWVSSRGDIPDEAHHDQNQDRDRRSAHRQHQREQRVVQVQLVAEQVQRHGDGLDRDGPTEQQGVV